MIYVLTILVLFALILHYDVNGNTKNRMTAYYILLCWYIAVSGLQYCVGSDTPGYMHEYDSIQWSDVTWDSIFGLNNRQLGWILFLNVCKLISNDFVALKIIQAIFVNVVFFKFFKKQTKAIFTSILFYSLFMYLDFNFNVLRQSIAVAIFLLGYTYYVEKNWLKYYIYVLFAIMFHNSAAIFLLLPFLQLITISRKSLVLSTIAILVCLLGIRLLPLTDFFLNHLSTFAYFVDITTFGKQYLESEKYGYSTTSLIPYVVYPILYLWVIIFNYRNNLYKSNIDLLTAFAYILILALAFSVPIFYRFIFYLMPIFIYLLSNFVVNYPKRRLAYFRIIFVVMLIVLFGNTSIRGLFRINTSYDDTQLIQYYPYYTVFDKQISSERARLWGTY